MTTLSIPPGEDVVAFILGWRASEDAWVSGVGAVEAVQLAVATDDGERTLVVPGNVTLLSLAGPRKGPLMAVVAPFGVDGTVKGGRLVAARSLGVMLSIGDAERVGASATDGDAPPTIATAASPNTTVEIPSVAADEETEEEPRYGDYVDHFVFGLCEVMVVRGPRMKIRNVTGVGKLREIHLGAMKVLKPTEEGGRRVFRLVKRG